MVRLTCYGGVGEIGGNKILLETGERRLFFDFGKSFGCYGRFFDGVFIKDRVGRGLLDPLSLGLVPPLRGLLRDDLIPALDPTGLAVTTIEPQGRQRKPRTHVTLTPDTADSFWQHWERQSPLYRDLRRAHAAPVDLVLLSHAHQDHISDLEYVSPDVPACSTRMTAFISKVLLDTGLETSGAPYVALRSPRSDGMLEVAREGGYRPRPWVFLGDPPDGSLDDDPLANPLSFWSRAGTHDLAWLSHPLPPGLQLRHWPVDHSLYGACAYAVETESGWVAYSGDLRFHGGQGPLSYAFAEGLAALRPTVLLCEGTRLQPGEQGRPSRVTETQVFENCLERVRQAEGELVVADFAPRNIERLQSFHCIAQETGRRLLVQPKDAYLMRAMHLADPAIPDLMQDPHLGLYQDPKVRPYAWEESVRRRYDSTSCGPQQVRGAPGEFLLAFSLTDIVDLLDLQFLLGRRAGGLYLFSNSQAYDDEQKADLVRLWHWTQHLGMDVAGLEPHRHDWRGEVIDVATQPGFHASGHAAPEDLVDLVRRVQPKILIPIHTEVPERWIELMKGTSIAVQLPEMGKPIAL
ncbi:MAG: MBL fold metallo-hydrolase RNA specificity domain-containing protein [Chloroflexota bacterium]